MKGFNLISGETSTLWQIEFSNYLKQRMDQKEKAITFSIVCDVFNGEKGVFYTNFSKRD